MRQRVQVRSIAMYTVKPLHLFYFIYSSFIYDISLEQRVLLRNQIGSTTKFNRPESVFMEARTLLIPTTEYDVHALRVRLYKRYSTAVLIPVRTPEELWNLCL